MKIYALITGLLLIAGSAFAANIDGTWSGEFVGGMGGQPMKLSYTFKADGNTLTGTHSNGMGEPIPIKDGKIDGDNISFTVAVDFGQMKMTFKYTGIVKGDEIELTFKMDMPGGGPGGGAGGGPGGGTPPPATFTVKREK